MIFSSTDVLSEAQLKRLAQHKYHSTGTTLLDPWMQKFWCWFVTKLPLWLAPNLMTIIGLLVNAITTLILVIYSPDARINAPGWTFFLFALGLFIYQTLDACDGKQARRTSSSSPLGELFDHGCDSISAVLLAIAGSIAVQLGTYPGWMFYLCIMTSVLFYTAHWVTYVSACLHFGRIDVTEAQMTIILLHLISAIFGSQIWTSRVPLLHLELNIFLCYLTLTGSVILVYGYGKTIITGGVGKNGSTVAGTSVLSPFIPLALVVIPAFIIYQKSPTNLYENHPCLYLFTFCFVIAKITNKLVVAHMTKSELEYFDSALIGPGMLFMNQYFNSFLNEYIVLWVAFLYTVIDVLYYGAIVCVQISESLKISIFSIKPSSSSLSIGSHLNLNSNKSNEKSTIKSTINGREKKYNLRAGRHQ